MDEGNGNWTGKVGVVPDIMGDIGVSPENTVAVICGRCNIDHRYICNDGPVFRMDTIPES